MKISIERRMDVIYLKQSKTFPLKGKCKYIDFNAIFEFIKAYSSRAIFNNNSFVAKNVIRFPSEIQATT